MGGKEEKIVKALQEIMKDPSHELHRYIFDAFVEMKPLIKEKKGRGAPKSPLLQEMGPSLQKYATTSRFVLDTTPAKRGHIVIQCRMNPMINELLLSVMGVSKLKPTRAGFVIPLEKHVAEVLLHNRLHIFPTEQAQLVHIQPGAFVRVKADRQGSHWHPYYSSDVKKASLDRKILSSNKMTGKEYGIVKGLQDGWVKVLVRDHVKDYYAYYDFMDLEYYADAPELALQSQVPCTVSCVVLLHL